VYVDDRYHAGVGLIEYSGPSGLRLAREDFFELEAQFRPLAAVELRPLVYVETEQLLAS
jgi:hypothetical protein